MRVRMQDVSIRANEPVRDCHPVGAEGQPSRADPIAERENRERSPYTAPMKRRQDVILKILQWLENCESPWNDLPDTLADPANGQLMDAALIRYHIDLCEQAGFIRMKEGKNPQIQLTWAGHEELEARRSR